MPVPVTPVVEGGVEVHVSVFQLGEQVGENLEELVVVHRAFHAYLIYIVEFVPVEPIDLLLVVEETVVLIDDTPQGLEVTLRSVFVLDYVDARNEE